MTQTGNTLGTKLSHHSTLKKRIKVGSVSFTYLSLLVFAGLIIFYVSQAATVANKGYGLSALEKEVAALNGEQQRLEVEAARLKALQHIENSVLSLDEKSDFNQRILEQEQMNQYFQQLQDEEGSDSLSVAPLVPAPKMVLVDAPIFISDTNVFADLPTESNDQFIN